MEAFAPAYDPNTLLERVNSGVRVAVAFLPIMEMATLTVSTSDDCVAHTIPADKMREAFDHPALFLAPNQAERIFN